MDQAVIITFKYGKQTLDDLFHLENEIAEIIEKEDIGEYDGYDISADYSDATIYMYGPNAEKIFSVVKPILENREFMKGAKVKLRFGPPESNIDEVEVFI